MYVCARFRACVHFAWRVMVSRAPRSAQLCFCWSSLRHSCAPERWACPSSRIARAPHARLEKQSASQKKTVMAQARAMPADISLGWRMSCMCQVYISGRQKKKMKKLCHTNSPFEHKRLSKKKPSHLSINASLETIANFQWNCKCAHRALMPQRKGTT